MIRHYNIHTHPHKLNTNTHPHYITQIIIYTHFIQTNRHAYTYTCIFAFKWNVLVAGNNVNQNRNKNINSMELFCMRLRHFCGCVCVRAHLGVNKFWMPFMWAAHHFTAHRYIASATDTYTQIYSFIEYSHIHLQMPARALSLSRAYECNFTQPNATEQRKNYFFFHTTKNHTKKRTNKFKSNKFPKNAQSFRG